jgi:hypothetical protein
MFEYLHIKNINMENPHLCGGRFFFIQIILTKFSINEKINFE